MDMYTAGKWTRVFGENMGGLTFLNIFVFSKLKVFLKSKE